ncbi:hypothetical protein NBH00_01320 [Paraconexibacter antarcticus]|uniref:Uncharacterized protein n=1 Tax=Paraconexibacter antarcticus TaxID=2949664 RepID=A0ABY5DW40_9ACTN|nr:hypothetical protein [Paraconexibacter antarcticus]UTI64860.1 hypothetical protein NBH00_01320 [Paraconexibacter antarcticus]
MFIQNEEHPVFVEPHVEGHETMLPGTMRALAEAGYLDVDPGAPGEFGPFRLTEAGRAEAVRLARSTTRQPVDLSWEAVRPVLVVAVAAVERVVGGELAAFDDIARDLAGVMPRGSAGRALETLRDNGYVELVEEMGNDEPLEVRLLPPALQEVRGWPGPMSAEGVVERLFEALDRAIAATEDETQISRLIKLRAAASDVGKSVLAGAILTAGKAATGV